MTLEKPTPDGRLILHWLDPMAEAKIFPLTQVKHHQPHADYLFLHILPRRHLYIPWTSLRQFEVIPNSDEYMEALEAWSGEDHRNHTEFVDHCTMCLETYRSNMMAAPRVLYISPGDDN